MGMNEVLALPQESPTDWGAQVNYDLWTPYYKDGVTAHYVGENPLVERLLRNHTYCIWRLRAIETYHMTDKPNGNGWNGIGYNYTICPHGILFRCRGRAIAAANPSDSDGDGLSDNIDSLNVLLLVGGSDRLTDAMVITLYQVFDAMAGGVFKHNDARQTYCPGPYVGAVVDTYKEIMMANDHRLTEHVDADRAEPADFAKRAWDYWRAQGLLSEHSKAGRALTYELFAVLMYRLVEDGWLVKGVPTHDHPAKPYDHGHPHNHNAVYAPKTHSHPAVDHTHGDLAEADHTHPLEDHTHGGVDGLA